MSVNFIPGHFDGPSFSCLSFSALPSPKVTIFMPIANTNDVRLKLYSQIAFLKIYVYVINSTLSPNLSRAFLECLFRDFVPRVTGKVGVMEFGLDSAVKIEVAIAAMSSRSYRLRVIDV